MKYIPNILSLVRLFLVIPLATLPLFGVPFTIVYVVAILTDLLDGPLARKFNVTSQIGATLDSIADVTMALVVIFRVLPSLEVSTWIVVWIFIAIGMKFLGAGIGFVRYKKVVFLHSYANKFFVLMLCFFPIFYIFLEADTVLAGLLVLAMFAFSEDIYINSTSKELDLDVKGIFFK